MPSLPRRALCSGVLACILIGGSKAALPHLSTGITVSAARPDDETSYRLTCVACHKLPPPDILPKHKWRSEVVRMTFIRVQQPPPLAEITQITLPDDMAAALRYLETRAPEHLPPPEQCPDPAESPVKFTSYGLTLPDMPRDPVVSNVQLVDFDGDGKLDVLGTEMKEGVVFWGHVRPGAPLNLIANVPHPDHVTLTDVDKDGIRDLLVADLGRFLPGDHRDGAIVWMRGTGGGQFTTMALDGWPRIADIEAADFNGDGKNDLAIAAFGWRTTGNITILENGTRDPARPSFAPHTIDPRPGAIHVIPTDLNRDGHMDFITVLSQQFETIVAFMNTGKGDFSFVAETLYTAPHPNWGSTGIQVVDLDTDGDADVLYTHGDTLDDGLVKPYHGIQWIENRGAGKWEAHDVAAMPGVHRAVAADVDGDGDLDVVASALLAAGSDVDERQLPALAWLEQTRRGVFVRHTIEMGFPRHATLDVGDVDSDGDMDVITGYASTDKPAASWVDVWLNQARSPDRGR